MTTLLTYKRRLPVRKGCRRARSPVIAPAIKLRLRPACKPCRPGALLFLVSF